MEEETLIDDTALDVDVTEGSLSLEEPVEKPEEGGLISLDTQGGIPVPPQEVAEQRALKADIALGDKSPGRDALLNGILTGQEEIYRKNAAIQKDIQTRQLKLEIIRGLTAAKKEPLTSEEQEQIIALSAEETTNVKTNLEEDYGRAFVNKAVEVAPTEGPVSKALEKDPDAVFDRMDVASQSIAWNEVVQKKVEDLQARQKDQGVVGTILDLTASILPGYSWELRQNAVKRAPTTSFLPGGNVEEQIAYLHTLPLSRREAELSQAIEDIAKKNVTEAINFARDVQAYSVSSAYLDSLFGIIDLTTPLDILGIGVKLAKTSRQTLSLSKAAKEYDKTVIEGKGGKTVVEGDAEAVQAVSQAMRGVVEGAAGPKLDLETALTANGNVREAARLSTANILTLGGDPLGDASKLLKNVPSLIRPEAWFNKPGDFSREAADRLANHALTKAKAMLQVTSNLSKVDRLPEEALQVAFKEAEEEIRKQYVHLNDSIVNVALKTRPEESDANVGSVSIFLGQTNALPFPTKKIAAHFAVDRYQIPDAEIVQQGNGYYIRVDKNIDETSDAVRAAILTSDNVNPSGFVNQLLTQFGASLRSADDTLSSFQNKNRKGAVLALQELHRVMKEVAKPFSKLSKTERQNFETILRDNRDYVTHDEHGNVQRGKYYRSLSELNEAYRDRFGRGVSEKEAEAYFSFLQINDLDFVFRNLGLVRDKARQGIENASYSLKVKNEDGSLSNAKTSKFEAKKVKSLPDRGAKEDAGILIHEADQPQGRFLRLNSMTNEDVDFINKLVAENGYEILQIADPLKKPLAKWAGTKETVNFVIASNVKREKLDWQQLPYREGGHSEYEYSFYLKQPKIARVGEGEHTRHIFEGDTTIFAFHSGEQASKFEKRMHEARLMLIRGDAGLSDYVQKNLGMTEKQFKGLFEPKETGGGGGGDGRIITPGDPFLRLEDPIVIVKAGRSSIDDHKWGDKYKNFEDNIRSSYNLWGNIDKKFTGERDDLLKTIEESPDGLVNLVPAKNIDPFTTLQRATSNMIRSRLLTDYKIAAVEQWIAQYGHLLAVPSEFVRANPVHYIHNPVWDSRAADQALLASAQASRSSILNLLGTDTRTTKAVQSLKESVLDSIYTRFGQAASDRVVENKLMQGKDPLKTARAVAFHSKLGLFAWPQFFTQFSTVAHMVALTPQHAIPGVASGTLMRWLALNANPQQVEYYAKIAEKFGMKREWFKESYDEMLRTGLYNVEGEHAFKDNIVDFNIIEGAGGKILDWGAAPFREGERLARLASWNAAYREWRVANPDAQLTNSVRNTILNRMDTMMVNMTRASNASWQNGVMSVPTQFMGYQIRMMEQMLGGRLTVPERARLFGMYSFLYGIPKGIETTAVVSVGTALLAGENFYDYVRQKAIESGYNPGDVSVVSTLMGGVADQMWKIVTGGDYNISEKYGPGGINMREIMEKNAIELALGASGGILSDILGTTDPFLKSVAAAFTDEEFQMKAEDVIDAFRNVSSVNTAVKMIYALNTGKYITKGQVALSDVTPGTAIFAAITGTQPQDLVTMRDMMNSLKHQKEAKDEAQKLINKDMRLALEALKNGDHQRYLDYRNRVQVYIRAGGFRPDELGKVAQEALGGNIDLLTSVRSKFILNAPQGEHMKRLEQFKDKK